MDAIKRRREKSFATLPPWTQLLCLGVFICGFAGLGTATVEAQSPKRQHYMVMVDNDN